jgi:hypothetical protein
MELKGKISLVTDADLVSLSISTDAWPNKHKFEDHWVNKVPSKSHRIDVQTIFQLFPEYKLIFK